MKKTLLFTLPILSLFSVALYGQTGPAGVGNSTTNTNWHDANSMSLTNGQSVTTFTDKSGNSNDIVQINTLKKPIFTTGAINGLPVLRFDGANDFMESGANALLDAANITYFVVYDKAPLESQSFVGANYTSQQRKWASYCNSNNNFIYNVQYSPTLKWSRFNDLNTATFLSHHITPVNSRSWRQGVSGNLRTATFTTPSGHQNTTIGRLPDATNDGSCLNGDIAEVFIFNQVVNDLERIMIENYLGAKYGLAIPTDRYAHQGTHQFGLVGIGNDGTNSQTTAQGAGILEVSNATSLASGDYMLVANSGEDLSLFTTSDIPTGQGIDSHKRFTRSWRVGETNECGTVDYKFYLNGGNNFGATTQYRLLWDQTTQNGDFSDATVVTGTYNGTEQSVVFSIDAADGDYITLCGLEQVLDINSVMTGDWSNPLTWDCTCIPTQNDNVNVVGGHTVTVDIDAHAGYLELNGVLEMDQAFSLSLYTDLDIFTEPVITDGEIIWIGSGYQYVDATGLDVKFNDMTFNNPGNTIEFFSANYTLNGTMTPTAGNLTFNDTPTDQFIINSTSATEGGRIGPIEAAFSFTGNFTVRRNIPAGVAGWRNISSNIANGNLSMWDEDLEMSGDGFPDGCAYGPGGCFHSVVDYHSFGYHDVTDPNLVLEPCTGLEVFMGDDTVVFSGTTLNLTGTLNTGDVSRFFTTGWNIHGNPYASAISWPDVSHGGIDNYFYIWDDAAGTFQWYDGASNTSSVGTLANGILASGQGYWAHDFGTIVYHQSDKVTNTGTFIKSNQKDNAVYVTLSENNSTYYTKLAFEESLIAFDGFDTLGDIRNLMTGKEKAPSLAFDFEEDLVRKNYMLMDGRDKSFNLFSKFLNEGYYTIAAENLNGFNHYSKVLIFDTEAQEYFDLKKDPSYTFFAEAGESNRFQLILTNSQQELNSAFAGIDDNENNLTITQMGNLIDIKNFGDNLENTQVYLVNLLGQTEIVFDMNNLENGSNVIEVPADINGVHFVTIVANGERITKKLVF